MTSDRGLQYDLYYWDPDLVVHKQVLFTFFDDIIIGEWWSDLDNYLLNVYTEKFASPAAEHAIISNTDCTTS